MPRACSAPTSMSRAVSRNRYSLASTTNSRIRAACHSTPCGLISVSFNCQRSTSTTTRSRSQDVEYDDIWAFSVGYNRPLTDRTRIGFGFMYAGDMVDDDERTMTLRLDSLWSAGRRHRLAMDRSSHGHCEPELHEDRRRAHHVTAAWPARHRDRRVRGPRDNLAERGTQFRHPLGLPRYHPRPGDRLLYWIPHCSFSTASCCSRYSRRLPAQGCFCDLPDGRSRPAGPSRTYLPYLVADGLGRASRRVFGIRERPRKQQVDVVRENPGPARPWLQANVVCLGRQVDTAPADHA